MEPNEEQREFQQQVGAKERRKLKAQREQKQSVWQGFSVFGVVGWSVAVPTVLFVLIGLWLDQRYTSKQSYTLALLLAGLTLGCLNAWYWVDKKMKEIQEENEEQDQNTSQ